MTEVSCLIIQIRKDLKDWKYLYIFLSKYFSLPTDKIRLFVYISFCWLVPSAYPSVPTAIKKKQAPGAIWGLFSDAVTASGNDSCGQYSTNNQTKENNTLCTNTWKAKEDTENRHHLQELPHKKGKQEAITVRERQNPTWHPDGQAPWSCCLSGRQRKIKNLHQFLVQNWHCINNDRAKVQ